MPEARQSDGWNGFAARTPILMADRTARAIEQVCSGDHVLAFDGVGPLLPRRVVRVFKRRERPLMSIGHTLLTGRHALLTVEGLWQRAWDFLEGDRLIRWDGTLHVIEHVVRVAAKEPVYDLGVEEFYSFVAGRHGFRVKC